MRKWRNYLEGLMMPEASLRMVSLARSAKRIPRQLNADSARFRAAFGNVGRALSPIKHSASTVKFSNRTSTVGRDIPTLQQN